MYASRNAIRTVSNMKALAGTSAVAIDDHAILIEGPPGSGKSSVALALIDRGAVLIGDDGVSLESNADRVVVAPPPNIAGKLEIRGVGIVEMETATARLALILVLEFDAPRLPLDIERRDMIGCSIPVLPFRAGDAIQALRAEWALRTYGLSF